MRRHAWLPVAAGALVVVLGAVAAASVGVARAEPMDEVTAAVGQSIVLDGEQAHTVVRTERWYGGGFWYPKPGQVAVTTEIRVQALGKTSYNPMYYAVRDSAGTQYGRVVLGYRYPALTSSASATAGENVDGWLTFLVPAAKVDDLTLEYHMHGGFGSMLKVRLGAVPDSQRARLGATVTIAGEQAHTVSAAGVWKSTGVFRPKAGQVYVTWKVRVKALAPTTAGGSFYSLRSADGQSYHGIVLGHREPRLPYKVSLAKGRVAQGWVTSIVPKGKVAGLTIVYHMHDNGPNLLVPFASRAS